MSDPHNFLDELDSGEPGYRCVITKSGRFTYHWSVVHGLMEHHGASMTFGGAKRAIQRSVRKWKQRSAVIFDEML